MRERLTFANVMSALAVFIALGGSAVAIQRNSVNTKHLKRGAVTSAKVKNESLQGKDLSRDTITSRELRESALHFERFFAIDSTQLSCDPSGAAFVNCGQVTVNTQEPSQLLMLAGGTQNGTPSNEVNGATGACQFRIDGTRLLPHSPVMLGSKEASPTAGGHGFSFSSSIKRGEMLEPGEHTVELICNETNADVTFSTTLSVLALGGEGVD